MARDGDFPCSLRDGIRFGKGRRSGSCGDIADTRSRDAHQCCCCNNADNGCNRGDLRGVLAYPSRGITPASVIAPESALPARIGLAQWVIATVSIWTPSRRHDGLAGEEIDGPRRESVVRVRVFPDAVCNLSSRRVGARPGQNRGSPKASFRQRQSRRGGRASWHQLAPAPSAARSSPPPARGPSCDPRTLTTRFADFAGAVLHVRQPPTSVACRPFLACSDEPA